MSFDDRDRKQLRELRRMVHENHVLLKRTQRARRWSTALRVLYYVLIIAVIYGAFVFLQPVVDSVKGTVTEVRDGIQGIQSAGQSVLDTGSNLFNGSSSN